MIVEQEAKNSVCASCGTFFVCGAVAGMQDCWCMEKPTGFFFGETGASCYCPVCLDKRISEQISPGA